MINLGNLEISKMFLGQTEVTSMYLGDTQVYGDSGNWIVDSDSYIVGSDGQYYERLVNGTIPEVDLNNNDWKVDTVGTSYDTDQDFNYYMSDKNYHVNSSYSQFKVSWSGITQFHLKYRSSGETDYDYVVIGPLDGNKFSSQPSYTTSGILANTKGNQGGNYKDLYIDCDEGEHHVWIAYRKDSSSNMGDDRGYIGVPKQIIIGTSEKRGNLLPSTYIPSTEYAIIDDEHVGVKKIRRYTIPNGNTVDNQEDYNIDEPILCDYLTYTLRDGINETNIILDKYDNFVSSTGQSLSLEYQINDGDWVTWDMQQFTLSRDTETGKGYVKFRGVNPNWCAYNNTNYEVSLKSDNNVNVSGNVLSLIGGEKTSIELNTSLYRLFSGSNIVDASQLLLLPLKFTNGKEYNSMFRDCISLTQAPNLPATQLSPSCYYYMFAYCSSLTAAPDLPSTQLSPSCYYYMFANCSSLTQAPNLPSTKLYEDCYNHMFAYCSSLTQAPDLPSYSLAKNCYYGLFYGCSSLKRAPELHATSLYAGSYCYMFQDCKNLSYVKCLAWSPSSYDETVNWLHNVASGGVFHKSKDSRWSQGSSGIPFGWTQIEV